MHVVTGVARRNSASLMAREFKGLALTWRPLHADEMSELAPRSVLVLRQPVER
jgi:hypothetical protein